MAGPYQIQESLTMTWDMRRWPNFTKAELSCSCGCNKFIRDDAALDTLQALRNRMGALAITSATRCSTHNKAEGGGRNSEHLRGKAFDISIAGHDRAKLLSEARAVGFTGFGYGKNFLHVDTGRARWWDYGPESREAWAGIAP